MKYDVYIGLEVHAELCTKTKIFCGCENSFGGVVNSRTCPVCLALPGAMPTLNSEVVDYCIKMGHALNCVINRICKQDRKNYFYPDLTKSYQISQYDIPLCGKGNLEVVMEDGVRNIGITRIHIEEDAGKLLHLENVNGALVDYNRCGVPLIEIVSEPDIRSSAEAKAYLETIKQILLYLGISDAKMQEGSIRCDINVSLCPAGSETLGTRTEMKNVNSFSGAARAIEYEIARQTEVLNGGGVIEQCTLRWDDMKGQNFLLRKKEDAQDYRYFREPDLETIEVSQERVEKLKAEIIELPNNKTIRYMNEFDFAFIDAYLLSESKEKSLFFDSCIALSKKSAKAISNWIMGDVSRILNERNISIEQTALTAENLTEMISLIEDNTISNTAAKKVIEIIIDKDISPKEIVESEGLAQNSDSDALAAMVSKIIEANPNAVTDFKNGKTNAVGFLVGQCMKESRGKANPQILNKLITDYLNGN